MSDEKKKDLCGFEITDGMIKAGAAVLEGLLIEDYGEGCGATQAEYEEVSKMVLVAALSNIKIKVSFEE